MTSDSPMVVAFLALPVVPELKLTDRGLVDVVTGNFIRAGKETSQTLPLLTP